MTPIEQFGLIFFALTLVVGLRAVKDYDDRQAQRRRDAERFARDLTEWEDPH